MNTSINNQISVPPSVAIFQEVESAIAERRPLNEELITELYQQTAFGQLASPEEVSDFVSDLAQTVADRVATEGGVNNVDAQPEVETSEPEVEAQEPDSTQSASDNADASEPTGNSNGSTSVEIINVGASDSVFRGGAGDQRITGEESDNSINGGAGDDRLFGNGGNDTLRGGSGNDVIAGGEGDDRLVGGTGDDVLAGGQGNDRLVAGDGNDTLSGGSGDDILVGGDGTDTFIFEIGDDNDRIRRFTDDEDILDLTDFLFADVDEALSQAEQVGNNVVFDFENGDSLQVDNITIQDLSDDLLIA